MKIKCPKTGCIIKAVAYVLAPVVITAAIINFTPPVISSIFLNPDKFMKIAQYKQLKAQEKMQKDALQTIKSDILDPNGNLLGNKSDPVVGNGNFAVVEYMDYKCGYCKKAHTELKKVLQDEKYSGKVRVIIKHYPVIGGEVSLYAAEVSSSFYAKYPERFPEFHSKLLESKLENTGDVDAVLTQFGVKFDDIKNDTIRQAIIENFNFARKIGVAGTPAFVIGDEFIGGFVESKDLSAKIDKHIGKSKNQ